MGPVEKKLIETFEQFNEYLRTVDANDAKRFQISQLTIVRNGTHASEMNYVRTYDIRTTPPEVAG